jgi:serine/threonine protein kinase
LIKDGLGSSITQSTFITKQKGGLKERYQIGKKLGEGGFGEVRFCRERGSKDPRAVKFLRKNMLNEEDKKQIMHEVDILA